MGSLYITRWPDNFADVEITGTTVQYLDTGEVLFANEMFSPGMQLCKWRSRVTYLDQGIKPSLPLLEVGKQYVVSAALTADRTPAVQLKITFFDINDEKIGMLSSDDLSQEFTFPEGAVSYEVALVNLSHIWIKFQYLMIKEANDPRHVMASLGRTGGWVAVQADDTTGSDGQSAVLQIGRGPRTTVSVPQTTNSQPLTVLAYVNDANVAEVLAALQHKLASVNFTQVDYLPGQRDRLASESQTTIEKFTSQLIKK